ncbi:MULTISPECIES: response regulator [Pseudobacillus]|uniref:response regulator n=1 Tax=Pseudobacillus TaxID=108525 RepID=UPI00387A0566
MTSSIILIDDHQLFREGIRRIIEFEDNFEILAEGNNGVEALTLYQEHRPDIILLDINMPILNGVEATKEIMKRDPNAKIAILSFHDDESYVTHVLQAGAVGYMLKDMGAADLIRALNIILDGGSFLHPRITKNVLEDYRRISIHKTGFRQKEVARPFHLLTPRECDILQLLADGKSNRAIGEHLDISDKTVKNHVSSVLQKMNVNDRTQAVVSAIKKGWVEVR